MKSIITVKKSTPPVPPSDNVWVRSSAHPNGASIVYNLLRELGYAVGNGDTRGVSWRRSARHWWRRIELRSHSIDSFDWLSGAITNLALHAPFASVDHSLPRPLGNNKVILFWRDPVICLESHFSRLVRWYGYKGDFKTFLFEPVHPYQISPIEEWATYYEAWVAFIVATMDVGDLPRNVLVGNFDRFKNQAEFETQRVMKFLNVDDASYSKESLATAALTKNESDFFGSGETKRSLDSENNCAALIYERTGPVVNILSKLSSDERLVQQDLSFLGSAPVLNGLGLLTSSQRFVEDRRNLALSQIFGGLYPTARSTFRSGISALLLQFRFWVVRKGVRVLLKKDFHW